MYAVILAGGGGTRLWPLSRSDRPKPFLPLLGSETLLQRTVSRLTPLIAPDDVYVVTDLRYAELVREQLPAVPEANVVCEPMGRNTGPAVALAAVGIDRPERDVMIVLPADHQVADEAAFRQKLGVAAEVAERGLVADDVLVTLGIQPAGAETGYGYVLTHPPAEAIDGGEAFPVERFVEKPDRGRAEELIASGRAYWNSGIFVWRRDAVLGSLERYAPTIIGPMREALSAGGDPSSSYSRLPSISIDYALLEPASLDARVATVPGVGLGWSDLGSWSALLDISVGQLRGDQPRVVQHGESRDLDSDGLLVHSAGGRLVVTLGLSGTIVVDTPDVVLVCSRDRAQDVKRIVDRLSAEKETQRL